MGAPEFEPSQEQRKMVTVLVGMSVPIKTIAKNVGPVGISETTLRKHFAEELEHGKDQFVASLKANIVKAAQGGSVRAMTYLLDRIGGPEFSPRMRIGGMEDAAPIQVNSDTKVTIFLPDNGRTNNGG
jgi:hypothetical protein